MQGISTIPLQEFEIWKKMAEHSAVFSFELELTARCTCSCRHCYVCLDAGDRHATSKELSPEEIGRIADEAVARGAIWCLLTGGEPLLRDDFSEIYLSLKRKGMLVSVFTNAQILTDDHVRLFRRYPPRDIEITVYGVTRDTYERITGKPGSFAAFRGGLERLQRAGVRVRLKAMALRSNLHELPEISRFCRERTKDFFRFDPFLQLRIDGDKQKNAVIRAERLSALEIAAIERADAKRFDQLKGKCSELIHPERGRGDGSRLFSCGAGTGNFYVSYDGQFRLCSALCHPACTYDLRNGTLAEAWERLVPRVRSMTASGSEYADACGRCPLINLCMWCPAYAHLETGHLDAKVGYFCEVAQARRQSCAL